MIDNSQRESLIRLASVLPAGSEDRKIILAGLQSKLAGDGKTLQPGDRVEVRSKKGWEKGVVVEVRFNYRAKKTPWHLSFATDSGTDLKGDFRSNEYPMLATIVTYLGAGSASAVAESKARIQDRDQKDLDRQDKNLDILHNLDLNPGDVIEYKYTNGIVSEVVVRVNYQTGKVGIDSFKDRPYSKSMYLENLKKKKESLETLEYYWGIKKRSPADRSTRWLPATGIVRIISRAPNA